MDIKEIALKVAGEIYDVNFDEHKPSGKRLISFAEALIAEIAKQNEPVESQYKGSDGSWKSFDSKDHESNTRNSGDWEVRDLFAFPPTAEQIANETAEAIAEYCRNQDHYCLATEIESGAWKEFKK